MAIARQGCAEHRIESSKRPAMKHMFTYYELHHNQMDLSLQAMSATPVALRVCHRPCHVSHGCTPCVLSLYCSVLNINPCTRTEVFSMLFEYETFSPACFGAQNVVLAARYALCALLHELPIPAQCAQNTLLALSGGQKRQCLCLQQCDILRCCHCKALLFVNSGTWLRLCLHSLMLYSAS